MYRLLVCCKDSAHDTLKRHLHSSYETDLTTASVIDILYSWVQLRIALSDDSADFLAECLSRCLHRDEATSTELQVLRELVKQLGLEIDVTVQKEAYQPLTPEYHVISRALLAGLPKWIDQIDAVQVARDCCLFLHKCDLIAACQSLQCLRVLHATERIWCHKDGILRFADQAEHHLLIMLNLYPSYRLLWEAILLGKSRCR